LYSPSYYIKRGAIATVSTGSTYFLYADGTSEGAGSTSVKWVDISTVSLVACQAYTETDKTSSTYLADTDFDVTVSAGDKVVVNSSNKAVNGIYDVTLGSATRAKFRYDTSFANWMSKIYTNVLTNNLKTNVLNTYVSGDLMGQITGAYQAVSTGGSTVGNIYVPELSFPPTANYETYFTTAGQASELLHESNIDWYEQDFQKYVVNAIYYAPSTTGFPSAAGTAISRTIRSSTGNTLLNENDWSCSSSLKKPTNHLLKHRWVTFPNKVEVNCTKLDDFLHLKNTKIDFMWVDVQGAEDLVFSCAQETLKNTHYVYTEYSNQE
jgi:FkbM family methyltransferase